MDMILTKHAATRQQQRCLPPLIVNWLNEFGVTAHDHHGGEVLFFDKHSRKQIAAKFGHQVVDRLGGLMDAYAVVSHSGAVITVGYRSKRIKGH